MTVGDLAGNATTVLTRTREAVAAGAHLVTFPELMLTGYPPEDLVHRPSFRAASRACLARLADDLEAAGLGGVGVIVGFIDENDGPRNAAALLIEGRVAATYYKHHLPNYGVFDEERYFEPGEEFVAVRLFGADVGMTVCEDLWQDGGPFAVAALAGVSLIVNINSSPYQRNKDDERLPLIRRRAAEAGATVVYVNTVGAQDELVFDGDSMVVAADGTVLLRAPQYDEGLYYVDLQVPDAPEQPSAVHGANPGSPLASRPALSGWNPSTSLSGSMAAMILSASICGGSGNCTKIPFTRGSALSCEIRSSNSAALTLSGKF